eukprot:TRINITY_DN15297_c2_g1_i1.p1 TRINITY_DN15297_c2_g1~~TRINITY_DN15297_c2_g1_i1.p1  ORF type:complete len:114 (+),score=4.18 TRINITY_DN15297_c2_g1_i1:398-739(+)
MITSFFSLFSRFCLSCLKRNKFVALVILSFLKGKNKDNALDISCYISFYSSSFKLKVRERKRKKKRNSRQPQKKVNLKKKKREKDFIFLSLISALLFFIFFDPMFPTPNPLRE